MHANTEPNLRNKRTCEANAASENGSFISTVCVKSVPLDQFNPIQAGVFWNHIGLGHIVSPSVSLLFVVQLPPNLAW